MKRVGRDSVHLDLGSGQLSRDSFSVISGKQKRHISWVTEPGSLGAGVTAEPSFIESLLWARHSFKYLTSVNLTESLQNPHAVDTRNITSNSNG